jgi:hypothetical protein
LRTVALEPRNSHMPGPWSTNEYPRTPDDTFPAPRRAFAGRQGWDPVQGADALIDSIGLDALSLAHAPDAAPPD